MSRYLRASCDVEKMAERPAEALARRLYDALEIGDATAVRRALADGADPERGPAEEVERP